MFGRACPATARGEARAAWAASRQLAPRSVTPPFVHTRFRGDVLAEYTALSWGGSAVFVRSDRAVRIGGTWYASAIERDRFVVASLSRLARRIVRAARDRTRSWHSSLTQDQLELRVYELGHGEE